MIMKVMNEEYPTTSRDNRRIFSEGKSQETEILTNSTFCKLAVAGSSQGVLRVVSR